MTKKKEHQIPNFGLWTSVYTKVSVIEVDDGTFAAIIDHCLADENINPEDEPNIVSIFTEIVGECPYETAANAASLAEALYGEVANEVYIFSGEEESEPEVTTLEEIDSIIAKRYCEDDEQ